MKKFLPVIVGVAVVGLGAYFLLGQKGGGLPGVAKTYNLKTLKAVVDLGIPVKCSYKFGQVEYEGYVKGKQWRGTMQSADGRTGEVIMKDNCMWSWGDDKKGIKMCFEPVEGEEDLWDNPQNMTTDIDYICRPATITDAHFNPPADVTFTDLDQMMPGNLDMDSLNMDSGETLEDTSMPENMGMPEGMDIPDSPEDFDMSRYQGP